MSLKSNIAIYWHYMNCISKLQNKIKSKIDMIE